MPLDVNGQKAAHIQAVVNKTFSGRQKTVTCVYASGGSYTYAAVQMIFRPQQVVDPEIPSASGGKPGQPADMVAVAPLGTNFSGCVLIADTATATQAGVAACPFKYEIIEALPVGIVPGGTHIRVLLRRFR